MCIDFKGKAVTIRSVWPEDDYIIAETVIDCEGDGRGFYFHSGDNSNSVINGLTITNGYQSSRSGGKFIFSTVHNILPVGFAGEYRRRIRGDKRT